MCPFVRDRRRGSWVWAVLLLIGMGACGGGNGGASAPGPAPPQAPAPSAAAAPATEITGMLVRSPQPNGRTCKAAADCRSGFCVDGVCCDTACGGGVTTDCEACSLAAGARVGGTSGVVSRGRTCRPVAGACDVAESCDGRALTCPADTFKKVGTSCRNAKRVVRAFHRCRKRSGGADGRCRRRVLRYRCTEGTRLKSPTQYDARVNCRRGRALVSHRYTQNT